MPCDITAVPVMNFEQSDINSFAEPSCPNVDRDFNLGYTISEELNPIIESVREPLGIALGIRNECM